MILIIAGTEGCSVVCEGNITLNNKRYDELHCVGFNIEFHLSVNLSTEIRDFPCYISNCILEVIDFECSFLRNVSYTDFNETLNLGDKTVEEEKCTGKCIDNHLSKYFINANNLYCATIQSSDIKL